MPEPEVGQPPETVGDIAQLYLGNVLYALELAAVLLEGQGKAPDAAFYRGIARKLAEAHGTAKRQTARSVGGPANGGIAAE